jgi:hypothetical protein
MIDDSEVLYSRGDKSEKIKVEPPVKPIPER